MNVGLVTKCTRLSNESEVWLVLILTSIVPTHIQPVYTVFLVFFILYHTVMVSKHTKYLLDLGSSE